jgi:MFS family permease
VEDARHHRRSGNSRRDQDCAPEQGACGLNASWPSLAAGGKARLAVAAIFFIHGFITGAWVPHIPLAQQRLDLDLAMFGLALLALAAGAIAAMPVAGALVGRLGSARMTLITGVFFSLTFPGPALAREIQTFVLALLAFGAAVGAMDVAMNAQGIAIERHIRRPAMSLFHGMFSLGAMSGAAASVPMLAHFSAKVHLAAAVTLALAVVGISASYLLPEKLNNSNGRGGFFALPTRATIGLGSLCFVVLMAEGAVLDWSAIQLKEKFNLQAHEAGLGYAMFAGGMAAARLAGDRLRSRFGSAALVRWSGLVLAIGMSAALAATHETVSIIAYGLAGLGIGNIAPVLFGGGGRLEPDAPGRGVAAVVTLGYSGFVVGPPFIGLIGQSAGLSTALGLIVVGGLIISAAAKLAQAADID